MSAEALDTMVNSGNREWTKKAVKQFESDYEAWTTPKGKSWGKGMHREVFDLITEYKRNEC